MTDVIDAKPAIAAINELNDAKYVHIQALSKAYFDFMDAVKDMPGVENMRASGLHYFDLCYLLLEKAICLLNEIPKATK